MWDANRNFFPSTQDQENLNIDSWCFDLFHSWHVVSLGYCRPGSVLQQGGVMEVGQRYIVLLTFCKVVCREHLQQMLCECFDRWCCSAMVYSVQEMCDDLRANLLYMSHLQMGISAILCDLLPDTMCNYVTRQTYARTSLTFCAPSNLE